jgi:putative ABC transport system permease protein
MTRVPLTWRMLLRLYPPDFRDRYGESMLSFHRQRLAGAARTGESRRRVWRRAVVDLVTTAALEWARVISFRRAAPNPYTSAPRSEEDRMSIIGQELVQSVRSLRRSAGFSAAAIVTLALGISSTTAIFSVVSSVLLAPLPFPDPGRIVVPESRTISTGATGSSMSYADFMDWRDNQVFAQVAIYQGTQMDITGPSDPVRVRAAAVSPQFFGALGARPIAGRTLMPNDFPVDAPRAVVISDRLWRTQFGSRADIAGLTVEINGIKRAIVGVLSPDARWPLDADMWVPLRFTTEQDPDLQRRDNFIFESIARLKPGATIEGTRTVMAALAQRISVAQPNIRKDITMVPIPVLDAMLGPTTPRALWILLGAVGLLLLIGCVNVANLQLARAAARRRELAVRTALGASRFRLVRQSLVESGVLGLVGGTLGAVLSIWMVKMIVAVAPTDVPRIEMARVDFGVLAFTFAVSIAVALLFGLAPAVHSARLGGRQSLQEGDARGGSSRATTHTRRALVSIELALSVVLLAGAGLALRSVQRLRSVNTGFDRRNVLTASISLPGIRYNTKAKVIAFHYQLRDRLAAAPGIEAAGIVSASPLGAGGFYLGRSMVAEGREVIPANEITINWNVTTPGYFAALRIPILRGRDFTTQDDTASPPVMIVNETFAKRMFGGENPIGKRAMSSRDEKVERTIVGVVGDVKYYGASDSARALVWVPYAQNNAWGQGIITVRTRDNPAAALPAVKRELRALDGGIALANVATMDDAMDRSMASDRLIAVLLGAFASLALVLAAIGIFGVLSYAMAQRTRELGIRLALGAQRADVLWLVARETAPMVASGLIVGLGAALVLTRFVRTILYEISPNDPATFAVVAITLATVAVAAALVPARRASRVDPVIAIRSE